MKVVELVKILAACGMFLLPSSLSHRDVIAEGIYAAGRLLAEVLSWKDKPRSERRNLSYVLACMGRVIQHLEVFCELCSKTSTSSSSAEETVVLIIEILKAVLRVTRLTIAEETSMILDWDRKGELGKLSSYLTSYRTEFKKQLTTVQRELSMISAFQPRRSTALDHETCVVGRRSGLVLSLSEGLSSAVRRRTETERTKQSGSNQSPETVSTAFSAPSLSPETPVRDRVTERERVTEVSEIAAERPLFSQSRTTDMDLQSLNRTLFTASSLSPEQVLYYSELLYCIRPFVYALLVLWAKKESLEESGSGDQGRERTQSVFERLRRLLQSETAIRTAILIISLVMECYSIHLTQTALHQLRARERDVVATELIHEETVDEVQREDIQSLYRERTQRMVQLGVLLSNPKPELDEELHRRRLALWLYTLRSPIFDKATLPILRMVARWLRHVPLLSMLPSSVIEILQYMNRVHFYHSNS